MNYHETCSECSHKITAYTLPMNIGLLQAFVKFADKYIDIKRGLKKGEIGITNAQYSNFQNIRHFGIIEQSEKGQEWHLTKLGFLFYEGTMPIVTPCAFMNGNTLKSDHKAWQSHPHKQKEVFIYQIMPERFKQRSEYQMEKQEVIPEFNTLF